MMKRCAICGNDLGADLFAYANSEPCPPRDPRDEPLSAAEINRLPIRVRQYIHHLETDADPAGTLRRLLLMEHENTCLQAKVVEVDQNATDWHTHYDGARRGERQQQLRAEAAETAFQVCTEERDHLQTLRDLENEDAVRQVGRAVAAESALKERTEERARLEARRDELAAILTYIDDALNGAPSDFALSFPIVRRVADLEALLTARVAKGWVFPPSAEAGGGQYSITLTDVGRLMDMLKAVAVELEAGVVRARLDALREVHEYWEFEDASEEAFDGWLHALIKDSRARLALLLGSQEQQTPGPSK